MMDSLNSPETPTPADIRESARYSLYYHQAIKQSFIKLHPERMIKNPVMFVAEICAGLCLLEAIADSISGTVDAEFDWLVFFILFLTLLFANFAEALAEARGKAQANSLKNLRDETPARLLANGDLTSPQFDNVSSNQLQINDIVLVRKGETIPCDGEVVQGIALIDEAVVTGESSPVVREAGASRSGVTGGTTLLSEEVYVQITVEQGASFLDRMINLVERSRRQKTPNEIALVLLLATFTLMFLIVATSLHFAAKSMGYNIPNSIILSLLVCLIPTTIGSLLSAIGIAGIDRALRANVVAKSGKAVEVAGDINTVLLDKTGTITQGNRKATKLYEMSAIDAVEMSKICFLSSYADTTPEGRSILDLVDDSVGHLFVGAQLKNLVPVHFSDETRMSGCDWGSEKIRKGSMAAMSGWAKAHNIVFPSEAEVIANTISRRGGTPLILANEFKILGVIELQDTLKPGIVDRFARLKKMGLKIVMVSGDNPLTTQFIARKAGVDDFIAEAKAEDKLEYIKKEQAEGKLVAMMGDGTNDAPALAQADVGVAMNSGTQAAKEASNMVDMDSDPTKLIEIIEIGKQMLITRGALTTFSIANDLAKYFAIMPAVFLSVMPGINSLNIMHLHSPKSAIISALIFNTLIIPLLIPIALRGVRFVPRNSQDILKINLIYYGLGGVIAPFLGIKLIDEILLFLGF